MSFRQIGKLVAPFLNILYVYCAFEESAEAGFYFRRFAIIPICTYLHIQYLD